MKILKLSALNINSLKNKTEIDFEDLLSNNGLFAITGATGAGKSTLLDIITCALYGETPRLHNPNELMSRGTAEAYCEVEFEVKNRRYRSSWSIYKARKKPDGKIQPAKMELYDFQDNKIICSKIKEVKHKIEELSGLDFKKFTKSILLAQGSFDAFLKSNDGDRSSILEKITGTDIYAKISSRVFEKYKGYTSERDKLKESLDGIILLDNHHIEEYKATISTNKIKSQKISNQIKQNNYKIQYIKDLNLLQTESREIKSKFLAICTIKEQNRDNFTKLELATQALNLIPLYHQTTQLKKQMIDKQNELQTLKDKQDREIIKYRDIGKECIEISDTLSKEESIFDAQIGKIKQAKELETKIKREILLLNSNKNLLKKEKELQKDISKKLEPIKILIEDKTKEKDIIEIYLSDNMGDESLISEIKFISSQEETYHKQNKQILNNNEKFHFSFSTKDEYQRHINELSSHIKTLQANKELQIRIQNYEKDRETLEDNTACFLCGATSHPYIEENYIPNIDKATQEIENRQELLQRYNIELQNLKDMKILRDSVDGLKQELIKIYNTYHLDFPTSNIKTLIEKEKRYKLNQINKENLTKELQELAISNTQYKTQIEDIETNITNNNLFIIEDTIQKLKDKKIKILDIENLETYEIDISIKFKILKDKHINISSHLKEIKVSINYIQESIKNIDTRLIQNQDQLKKSLAIFDTKLKESNFTDEEDILNSNIEKESYDRLSKRLKEIENKFLETETLQTDIQERLKAKMQQDIEIIDTNILEEEIKDITIQLSSLDKEIGAIEEKLHLNNQNKITHHTTLQKIEAKEENLSIWIKLNELIGSNDGKKFRNYAQGITLDHLIFLANNHLSSLSKRYTITRGDKESLDMNIIDAYQVNQIRPISTLSGGESFIVSLSLALGLSQLASQNVKIGSLFLDEGFGTLDSDSLHLAIETLNLLQSNGKMVGVISHIETLKEAIPTQIQVISKGDGTSRIDLIKG